MAINKDLCPKNWPATIKAMKEMLRFSLSLCIGFGLILTLSSCSSHPDKQFWQRSNPSQSVYMRGAKAQQLLQRDIQNCVNELHELERLNQLDDPIPTSFDGYIKEADPATLYNIRVQGGDTALFSGATDYSNFDGCMYAKGWERIQNLPYSVTDRLNMNPRRVKPDENDMLPSAMRAPPQYDRDTTLYRNTNE